MLALVLVNNSQVRNSLSGGGDPGHNDLEPLAEQVGIGDGEEYERLVFLW